MRDQKVRAAGHAAEIAAAIRHAAIDRCADDLDVTAGLQRPAAGTAGELSPRGTMTLVFVDDKDADVCRLRVVVLPGGDHRAPARDAPFPSHRRELMSGTRMQEPDERVLLELDADVVPLRDACRAKRTESRMLGGDA